MTFTSKLRFKISQPVQYAWRKWHWMHPTCLMVEVIYFDVLKNNLIFLVTSLNMVSKEESIFGKTTILQPQGVCQFLYCLSPNEKLSADLKSLSGATNIGKLDIVWRSNLGERGRLQTSQLQRMVSEIKE